uniref:Uncharacterized protein n=1 Tax=Arundo donax TaxID=35708 RepID=A0A0A8XZS5_ARUDO
MGSPAEPIMSLAAATVLARELPIT